MLTRRAALKGGTAAVSCAAVTTAAGAVAASPHEPLLALWCERQRLRAVQKSLLAEAEVLEKAGDGDAYHRAEAKCSELEDVVFDELEHQISRSQARTIEGAAIQARILVEYLSAGQMTDDRDLHMGRNLAAGLERLAGRAQS